MLYTPLPGTPLYEEHRSNGSLLSDEEFPLADIHGQDRFNFSHPNIQNCDETKFLLRAFEEDFKINGPSIARVIRTRYEGWKYYQNHHDPAIKRRYQKAKHKLNSTYAYALYAMMKWYAKTDLKIAGEMNELLHELYEEFGWKTRLLAPLAGHYVYHQIKKETKRLESGWTYEPETRYMKNDAAIALMNNQKNHRKADSIHWVDAARCEEFYSEDRVDNNSDAIAV